MSSRKNIEILNIMNLILGDLFEAPPNNNETEVINDRKNVNF